MDSNSSGTNITTDNLSGEGEKKRDEVVVHNTTTPISREIWESGLCINNVSSPPLLRVFSSVLGAVLRCWR